MPGRHDPTRWDPWVRWVRRALWLLGLALACYGLWAMAVDADDLDRPIAMIAGGDVVLGMAYVVSRDSLDPTTAGHSLSRTVVPVTGALLLEVVVGFLLFPVTLEEGMSPDHSWFAVVPLVVVALGGGAFLLTLLLYLLVVAPTISLVLVAPAVVRGDPQARVTAVLDLVLIDVVAVSTVLAFVVDDGGGRAGLVTLLLTLGGLRDPLADSSTALLWLARALALLLVALLVTMRTLARRHPGVQRAWRS